MIIWDEAHDRVICEGGFNELNGIVSVRTAGEKPEIFREDYFTNDLELSAVASCCLETAANTRRGFQHKYYR